MTKLPDDLAAQLADHVALGNIREQVHPYLPLAIYNYTPQVQYSRSWDEVTLMSRGLILDIGTGEIVARPFRKFFNWAEWDPAKQADYFDRPHRITTKLDGSLGILYHWDGDWMIATRGSFGSDQAERGAKLLRQYDLSMVPTEGVTPLVEIIYPENRIVVDYGDYEGLIFLEAISISSGLALPSPWWKGPRAQTYVGDIMEVVALKSTSPGDLEGYVIRWDDGEMAKIKFDEYVRLHRVLTGTNAVRVWEAMQEPDLWAILLHHVPDEFYHWVKQVELDLHTQAVQIETAARLAYQDHAHLASISRKEFALWAAHHEYSDILFRMLDDKPYDSNVWKRIKPEPSRPFREEV
jgi:RNA ligase